MGLFDFFTIHVFSPVTGVVTLNGEPVEGAEVIRTASHHGDKLYSDKKHTDKSGGFSFEDLSTFSLRPIMLPTIIRQKVVIKYKGEEYLAWDTIKRNNYIYGELNDEGMTSPVKLNLKCELTDDQNKEKVIELKYMNRVITGLCDW